MKHEQKSLNTKKALAASLKKFMKKKPLSKITVSELITDCDINRKTFYYHFEDIYALLKWMLEEETVEIVQKFDLLVEYEEVISFVMDYVEENEHILNCALDSLGREGMEHFLRTDFIELTRQMILTLEENMNVTLEDDFRTFLCDFYTEALAGIIIRWFRDSNSLEREKAIRYIVLTMRTSLTGVLNSHTSIKE